MHLFFEDPPFKLLLLKLSKKKFSKCSFFLHFNIGGMPARYTLCVRYTLCAHCSSTEQLQVALRTYMSLMFGFNNEKSLHTLPLRSVPCLSLHLNPSLSKPSIRSPWSV
jgi:hypothetical protein